MSKAPQEKPEEHNSSGHLALSGTRESRRVRVRSAELDESSRRRPRDARYTRRHRCSVLIRRTGPGPASAGMAHFGFLIVAAIATSGVAAFAQDRFGSRTTFQHWRCGVRSNFKSSRLRISMTAKHSKAGPSVFNAEICLGPKRDMLANGCERLCSRQHQFPSLLQQLCFRTVMLYSLA